MKPDFTKEKIEIRNRILGLKDRFGIKELKKGGALARKLGVHNSVITRLIDQISFPTIENIMTICHNAGISADYLFFAKETPKKEIEIRQPVVVGGKAETELETRVKQDRLLPVPLAAGFIGAGHTGAIPWDYIEGMIYVPEQDLGRRAHHHLRAIRLAANADSMIPTLRPGDIVVVDPQEQPDLPLKFIDKKAIYAIRLEEAENAAIKRLRESGDFWVLLSDNPLKDPILLPKAEVPDLIIGRVIWSWRKWVR